MEDPGPGLLRPGEEVEGYRIEAFIGQGQLACVYGAIETQERTRHCLKLLISGSEKVFQRLVEEGEVLVNLRHPNIVGHRGVVQTRSGPALVMEPVDGCSLKVLLEDATLNEYEAVGIASQILRGLDVAHEAGIHHRDLRPANVLLAASDYDTNAKLSDFGIYNICIAGGRSATNRTGMTFGTPAYMSPEQLTNKDQNPVAVDIYGVGALLYHMLCGRPPYDGTTLLQIIKQRAAGTHPNPQELNENISDGMVTLLNDLLADNPGDRPESAKEVLRRLGQSAVPKAINGPLKEHVRKAAARRRGDEPKWPPTATEVIQKQEKIAKKAEAPPPESADDGTPPVLMALGVGVGCISLSLALAALAFGIFVGLQ